MRRALRGAKVQHVIGVARGLSAAKAMGLHGHLHLGGGPSPQACAERWASTTPPSSSPRSAGSFRHRTRPSVTAEAAVLFTSGRHGAGEGRRLPPRAARGAARRSFARRSASSRTIDSWPPSLPSPFSARPSESPPRFPTWTSPSPGTLTARALADAISSHRRLAGLRGARCSAQRAAHVGQARRRTAPTLRAGATPAVGRCPRSSRDAAGGVRGARRLRSTHSVRHDRGAYRSPTSPSTSSRPPGEATASWSVAPVPGAQVVDQPARRARERRPARSPTPLTSAARSACVDRT